MNCEECEEFLVDSEEREHGICLSCAHKNLRCKYCDVKRRKIRSAKPELMCPKCLEGYETACDRASDEMRGK